MDVAAACGGSLETWDCSCLSARGLWFLLLCDAPQPSAVLLLCMSGPGGQWFHRKLSLKVLCLCMGLHCPGQCTGGSQPHVSLNVVQLHLHVSCRQRWYVSPGPGLLGKGSVRHRFQSGCGWLSLVNLMPGRSLPASLVFQGDGIQGVCTFHMPQEPCCPHVGCIPQPWLRPALAYRPSAVLQLPAAAAGAATAPSCLHTCRCFAQSAFWQAGRQ
jgi:hypothetical protein